MGVWVIIVLGIVQGASEFLPISSSGHLVMFYNIFKITDNTILLSVILHAATLLAVVFCYRQELWQLIKNPFCQTNKKLIAATIPTCVIALLFKNMVEKTFSGDFIIAGFIITAVVLIISQLIESKHNKTIQKEILSQNKNFLAKTKNITNINISYKQALLIGVSQGVAIFPGVSRSGSTIATGLISGVKKQDAADFSFLLSIPIIIAGLVFEMFDVLQGNAVLNISWFNLSIGFLFSFVSGLVCIKLMLKFVKNKKLTWFSLYLFLLAVFLILNRYVLFLF